MTSLPVSVWSNDCQYSHLFSIFTNQSLPPPVGWFDDPAVTQSVLEVGVPSMLYLLLPVSSCWVSFVLLAAGWHYYFVFVLLSSTLAVILFLLVKLFDCLLMQCLLF